MPRCVLPEGRVVLEGPFHNIDGCCLHEKHPELVCRPYDAGERLRDIYDKIVIGVLNCSLAVCGIDVLR